MLILLLIFWAQRYIIIIIGKMAEKGHFLYMLNALLPFDGIILSLLLIINSS